MIILTSFIVPKNRRSDISTWVIDNELLEDHTYDWQYSVITFERSEDAAAFSLTFGIAPHDTVLDRMLRDEDRCDQ
jgi:hypothetical protein